MKTYFYEVVTARTMGGKHKEFNVQVINGKVVTSFGPGEIIESPIPLTATNKELSANR